MFYAAHGNIPPKRHTQHRAPDGSLYAEELFGVEGFTGRSSLLYHVTPPTRTHRIEPVGSTVALEEADDGYHHHRLIDAAGVEPQGDAVTGRVPLFYNADVVMGVVRPASAMPESTFYRNGEGDELLYVHEGSGLLDTVFGPIRYGAGDYLVLPIGTTWRLVPDDGSDQRMLYLECPSEIEPPKRYRNDYGQLLEHSPYSQRDIRASRRGRRRATDEGEFQVHVKMRGRLTAYHYRHHPFDVVGWDGYLWPFALQHRATSSRSPGGSTSRRRSTRHSRRGTSSSARSCRASSTTTRSRSRPRTTTRTSTPTRSSTTSQATS